MFPHRLLQHAKTNKRRKHPSLPTFPALYAPPQKTQSISKQNMKTDFYQPVTFFCEEKVLAVTNA
jgi:hypothetical protein